MTDLTPDEAGRRLVKPGTIAARYYAVGGEKQAQDVSSNQTLTTLSADWVLYSESLVRTVIPLAPNFWEQFLATDLGRLPNNVDLASQVFSLSIPFPDWIQAGALIGVLRGVRTSVWRYFEEFLGTIVLLDSPKNRTWRVKIQEIRVPDWLDQRNGFDKYITIRSLGLQSGETGLGLWPLQAAWKEGPRPRLVTGLAADNALALVQMFKKGNSNPYDALAEKSE